MFSIPTQVPPVTSHHYNNELQVLRNYKILFEEIVYKREAHMKH